MALVVAWRSNNNSFINFAVKTFAVLRAIYNVTRKYRLVTHRWIRLALLIIEQFNLLKMIYGMVPLKYPKMFRSRPRACPQGPKNGQKKCFL
jgi:hypothetical protein